MTGLNTTKPIVRPVAGRRRRWSQVFNGSVLPRVVAILLAFIFIVPSTGWWSAR